MIQSLCKVSHTPLFEGEESTEEEVIHALREARLAQQEWAALPLEKRIEVLHNFTKLVKESKEELTTLISRETGKPLWESKTEVAALAAKQQISIDAYQARCQQYSLGNEPTQMVCTHKPHGVIAILGPFNFPAHLPNGHIAPALLAGNALCFKPSEKTPAVGQKLVDLWHQAGVSKNVLHIVHGGAEVGRFLSMQESIDGLFFTGSWGVGQTLSAHFGKRPEKILALEMGGNNPLVVTSYQSLPAALLLTLQSAYLTSGQRCTAAKRLIVVESDETRGFVDALVRAAETLAIGPYTMDPEPFMGPVIDENVASKLLCIQEDLLQLGAKELLLMRRLLQGPSYLTPGLLDVTDVKKLPDHEIFGPLLLLTRVSSLEEAIRVANNTKYGLSAALVSSHVAEFHAFQHHIRAGIINWNAPTVGASSSLPFGGVGRSGNHRPSAYYAADYCSYPIASTIDHELTPPDSYPPGIFL